MIKHVVRNHIFLQSSRLNVNCTAVFQNKFKKKQPIGSNERLAVKLDGC